MGVTIGNVLGRTVVLTGVGLGFPNCLAKVRHTGFILGIHGDVVVPAIAVHGGHGETY